MKKYLFVLLCFAWVIFFDVSYAQSTTPVVQAVLFYSPTCPHCQDVIENVLPPIKNQYGSQIQFLGIDTTNPAGQKLFQAAIEYFEVPDSRLGVPALILGDSYLVGAQEIPEMLPRLIEEGLSAGGVGWPTIPGLREAVPDLPPSAGLSPNNNSNLADGAATIDNAPVDENLNSLEQPAEDRAGFLIAWIVLFGMVIALGYSIWAINRIGGQKKKVQPPYLFRSFWIPALAVIGLTAAAYLSYIELTQSTAVCGPIGECNIVQSSSYAKILGIPIAVLGIINYLAILGIWSFGRLSKRNNKGWTVPVLYGLAIIGVLFSIYLTILELFIIQAVCAWCLSSAIVTAIILILMSWELTKEQGKPSQDRHYPAPA